MRRGDIHLSVHTHRTAAQVSKRIREQFHAPLNHFQLKRANMFRVLLAPAFGYVQRVGFPNVSPAPLGPVDPVVSAYLIFRVNRHGVLARSPKLDEVIVQCAASLGAIAFQPGDLRTIQSYS